MQSRSNNEVHAAVRSALEDVLVPGITDAEQHLRREALIRRLATESDLIAYEHALAADIVSHAHAMPVLPPWEELHDDIIAFDEQVAVHLLLERPTSPAAYAEALYEDLFTHEVQFDCGPDVVMVSGLVELALTLRTLASLS